MIGMRSTLRATAWIAVVALVVVVAAPAFADAPGAETPEALVERMRAAAAEEDLGEVMSCLAPEARVEMASMMYLMATMVVAFSQMGVEMGTGMAEGLAEDATDEQKAEMEAQKQKAMAEAAKVRDGYNAVMTKYGLPVIPESGEAEEPEGDPKELFASMDQGAFLKDIFAFLESMPGEKEEGAEESKGPLDLGDGQLTDLVVDGDSASGKIGGEDVQFVRLDGRWFFAAEGMITPGAEAP